MRLVDLNPSLLSSGGSGVMRSDTGEPIPETKGVGLLCDCPCGNGDEEHQLYVPFANPIGPGPLVEREGWKRTGETVTTLTLTPSIHRVKERGGCGWHGFITDGEVRSV